MNPTLSKALAVGAIGVLAALPLTASQAQPAAGGGGRAPAETWYVNKSTTTVYTPPNKPLWKLADLLKMHAGQSNWSTPILKDDFQEVSYNSAAPGTKFGPRMHMEAATAIVVIKGEVNFQVEGQAPVTATRGSIVNILNDTIFSYDVGGAGNALWITIDPRGSKLVYPTSAPPPPAEPGRVLTKVAFAHKAPAYKGANKLMFNLFDAIAKCENLRGVVDDDHINISPLLGWVNPADNKCPAGGTGNIGGPGPNAEGQPFNPKSTFGHMHQGVREWWIVQSGQITGKFENTGEFHAEEGDVLNAEVDMWHQMSAHGPSGPSVRTAIGAYNIVNMNSIAGGK